MRPLGQGRLREVFLARLPPEVSAQLKARVLPTYRTLRAPHPPDPFAPARVSPWLVTTSGRPLRARLRELYDALQAWADRFNLNEPWVLDRAVWTMHGWLGISRLAASRWGVG